MALNEHNIKRQYTKYKRHVNESKERIDASTINKIQEDINIQQEESNTIKDTAFEERIYTIFNSNLYVNSMFVDYFRTGEYVNILSSQHDNVTPTVNSVAIRSHILLIIARLSLRTITPAAEPLRMVQSSSR